LSYTARTTALPRGFGFSPYLADSVGSASVVAGSVCKGSSVTFLTATQLPQGFYQVAIVTGLGNVAGASADLGNMVLQIGATTVTALAVNSGTQASTLYLSLSGADGLAIVAGYTATSTVQYMASVVATPMHLGA